MSQVPSFSVSIPKDILRSAAAKGCAVRWVKSKDLWELTPIPAESASVRIFRLHSNRFGGAEDTVTVTHESPEFGFVYVPPAAALEDWGVEIYSARKTQSEGAVEFFQRVWLSKSDLTPARVRAADSYLYDELAKARIGEASALSHFFSRKKTKKFKDDVDAADRKRKLTKSRVQLHRYRKKVAETGGKEGL